MADSHPVSAELSPLKRALLALEKMQARLDSIEAEIREPIAVIGMSCRFPGGVDSPESFWRMLTDGRDVVGVYPADRPGAGRWETASPDLEKTRLIRQGGFLTAVDQFDPAFFGISPREAMRMDPQQRILLQVACEAIDSAGLVLAELAGSRTGVFIGLHSQSSDYYSLQTARPEEMDTYTSTGSAHSIAANRLSYVFDLRGPSVVVDTACSSSLVALHLACQSLRARESTIALAGGVNLILSPETSLAFSKLEFLSPDGRCKTFDASANGFVRAEGCGIIVLKRLVDAQRDGDPILAVIRGTAVNQDGATNGLTAPNGLSQQAVVRAALENGRVDPAHITFIETHGTGTPLGDPIEIDALQGVLKGEVRRALGSVKTNIGHAEAAAGIAGVIKCVLALRHRTIPPNLHFHSLNPHINLAGSSFFVPTQSESWAGRDGSRFASVSSFGFGGTNGHVILQEAPVSTPARGTEVDRKTPAKETLLLPLSARSDQALDQLIVRWGKWLGETIDLESLKNLLYTAGVRRSHHSCRAAVIGTTVNEFQGKFTQLVAGRMPAGVVRGSVRAAPPQVVFVFCGQGPQWWGMGRELLRCESVFHDAIARCAIEMKRHVSWDLLAELSCDETASRLGETEIAQPALFALQFALSELWISWGVEPHVVVGHSVGEVAAACVAGVLSLADAVKVVCHRGRLMQGATGLGRMAAIELPGQEVEAMLGSLLDRVAVAAFNSPTSTVISGESAAVEQLVTIARDRGARTKLLPFNYAFHSPQMERFCAPMITAVAGIKINPAIVPLYTTVTGRLAAGEHFGAAYWGENIRKPVQFAGAVEAMLRDGVDTFIEIGPNAVLAPMIAQCAEVTGRKVRLLPSLRAGQPEQAQMLEALATLYIDGVPVRWSTVQPAGRTVPLPAYPWQNKSYWLEPAGVTSAFSGGSRRQKDFANAADRQPHGTRLSSPGISGVVFEQYLSLRSLAFIRDHEILGAWIVPAPVLIEMILGGATEVFNCEQSWIRDLVLHRALVLTEDDECSVHLVFESVSDAAATFSIHSCVPDPGTVPLWILHASGRVSLWDADEMPGSEAYLSLDRNGIASRMARDVVPQKFYDYFAERGANFGPAFRVVERYQHNETEALAETGPSVLPEPALDYFLHPVLWDAALQAIAVLSDARSTNSTGPARLFLFCGFDELRIHLGFAGPHVTCHARIHAQTAGEGDSFAGDVSIYSTEGVLAAEISGARFKSADREVLLAVNGPAVADLLHEVRWQPRHNLLHPLLREIPLSFPSLSEVSMAAGEFLRNERSDGGQADHAEVVSAFDSRSITYIKNAFAQLGWNPVAGCRFTTSDLIGRLRIVRKHTRLVERMIELLGGEQMLRREGEQWEVLQAFTPDEDALSSTEMVARFPDYRTEIEVFDRCASRLGEVLRGQCDPLQLLFPAGSTKSATRLYRDASMSRLPNALIKVVCERIRDAVPKDGIFRILEIGAGTGGTTAHLLPLMQGRSCEYVFSDVSQLFLHNARERFADYPFLRFALLDIELSPASQGFAPGQFDLIVAANAVHATRDLRRTLAHVRSLLVPGGIVALIEGFRPSRWVDLVFGQTEGWWRFTDTDLRPSHPLVALETWYRILGESGFGDSTGIPAKLVERPGLFDQAVILAQATDGTTTEHPDSGCNSTARHSSWLLIGGSGSEGRLLKNILPTQDQQVVLIEEECSEKELAGIISDTTQSFEYVVLLARANDIGLAADNPDKLFVSATALTVRALRVAQALINDSRPTRPRLWFVTHGAQPAGGSIPSDPMAAALWGLGRVLAVEHPEIWGGLIDVGSTANSSASARLIAGQILYSDGEDQCAFRGGARFVPRIVRQASHDPAPAINWQAEGSFIITGGLGGLGLHLAKWLAGRGARTLVLVGRTPLPARSEWDRAATHGRVRAQIDAIREIERHGTNVRTLAVDIANLSDLSKALTELKDGGCFPIRGLVHAAAEIDDLLIPQLGESGMAAVMKPKVLGALTLEKCLAGQPLEFFVCCSSVGSLLGQAGQANYAAANTVLDSLVYHRRAQGVPMLSINWGAWYGTGFAVTAGGRRTIRSLEQRGLLGFTPAEGLATLDFLLQHRTTQSVVMRVDEKKFRQSYPMGEEPPFLRELISGKPATQTGFAPVTKTGTVTGTNMRKQLLALDSGPARREKLQSHLASLLAAVLKMEPGMIDVEKPMGALGLDSLMGFELKNRCELSLDLKLSATMTWNYPTIAALTGFLAEKLDVPLVDESVPLSGERLGGSSIPAAAGAAESVTALDELSEEEAMNSLLKRKNAKD